MKTNSLKAFLFSGLLLIQFGCVGPALSTDAKNPPPQDLVTQGASGIGLMMNLVNLATGHLIKSKTNININFSMGCLADRFSLELQSKGKRVHYQEFLLAQQSKIEIKVPEGQYQLILKKMTAPSYDVKTDLRVTAENSEYSITACDEVNSGPSST
jgi:hypothetical protein